MPLEQFEPSRLLVFDDIFKKDDLVDVVDTHHHRELPKASICLYHFDFAIFFSDIFFFFLVLKIIDPSMILYHTSLSLSLIFNYILNFV